MFRLNLWPPRAFLPGQPGSNLPGLENSPYLPNPLTSPALMVLASSAEANRGETSPIAAHTASQREREKDLQLHFQPGNFPMYPHPEHIPPHLYAAMHPHFAARASLGLLNPSATGAFRPVTTSTDSEAYHSAFLPTKRQKLDDSSLISRDDDRRTTPEHRDTHSVGRSPSLKEENLASPTHSAGGQSNHSIGRRTPEDEHSHEEQRRWQYISEGQTPYCPICGTTLQKGEIEEHLIMEMKKLDVIGGHFKKPHSPEHPGSVESSTSSQQMINLHVDVNTQSRYQTYLRIRGNRHSRLSAKTKARKRRSHEDGDRLDSHHEGEHYHIIRDDNEDETVDIIGTGDNTSEDDRHLMRKFPRLDTNDSGIQTEPENTSGQNGITNAFIDSLKATIEKQQQKLSEVDLTKCQNCRQSYRVPLASIQCWHVHCEDCWIKILGTEKMCPQCNHSTCSADLRRVYI